MPTPALRHPKTATLVAASLLAASLARANELPSSVPSTGGFVVHSAEEVRERFCTSENGRLILGLPGGTSYELITCIDDPAILNHGDGAFHPFPESEVRLALAQIRFPLERVSAEVFILPYPRRAGLQSAAGAGVILLSPGVLELTPEQIHAELAHELGHVVHFALMPDADVSGWDRYRALRGIEDQTVYNAYSIHADRPHEIFAEDFRALFGGALANYSGSVENASLQAPGLVAGLRDFMTSLAGAAMPAPAAFVYPNPSRAGVRLSLPATGAPSAIDVFDAAGRHVRTLPARAEGARWSFDWDGRTASGERVAAGVYLARARAPNPPMLRVVMLPPR